MSTTTPLFNKTAPFISEVIARLQQAGHEAYIVGGAVRDILLGRKPKDYDISTSATPEQIRKVFSDHRCIIIGKRFRLVHLFHKNTIYEISTFRKCPEQIRPSTLPKRIETAPEHMIFNDNEFGSAEDDAHRRDFSVNALFYDPISDRIVDYTGNGMADMEAHSVRCIGDPDLRFEEDPVRMLRALKLVGQYGFTLETKTEESLKRCMPLIVHASISRMSLELEKILKNPYGSEIIRTFRQYGFLKYFLPVLDEHYETPQGKYVMALWRLRDEHVRAGRYHASMSLIYALVTLPFLERDAGRSCGELWPVVPDMEDLFRNRLLAVFHPHAIMRRDNANAVSNLLLQTRFRQLDVERYLNARAYSNSRELASLQNELNWHLESFETACPFRRGVESTGAPMWKKRKPRHHNKSGKMTLNGGEFIPERRADAV